MKNTVLVVGVLIFGLGAGYSIAAHQGDANAHGNEHMNTGDMHTHEHIHDAMEISTNDPVPEVELLIHRDLKSGWNAQISVANFQFAPQNVSGGHVMGEGHAHIYVNGEKINRVYGAWYHLDELSNGDEVSVRLSTNDHRELTQNGEIIMDTVIIENSDQDHESHEHNS